MRDIRKELFAISDDAYRSFQTKLLPSVAPERVIGVRIPVLRKYARELFDGGEAGDFLESLPHEYYDEDNLHAVLIERFHDFESVIELAERFLPYIDNWATCDLFMPAAFKKNKDKLLPHIFKWIDSGETYTVRYGIGMLMRLFLDEDFKAEYAERVAGVQSEEYYVKMMVAWYFATALAKRYDDVIAFLTERRLDEWTHNKTIQKAVESYRITSDTKTFLRGLRVSHR